MTLNSSNRWFQLNLYAPLKRKRAPKIEAVEQARIPVTAEAAR